MTALADTVLLWSRDLTVVVDPARGAQVSSIRDHRTDVDVLAQVPGVASAPVTDRAPTAPTWLASYTGGWQVLFPSGGDACVHQGSAHGFHGEASCSPWTVHEVMTNEVGGAVTLTTCLFNSPFRVERTIELVRRHVRITDETTNVGNEPRDYMWIHHPVLSADVTSGAEIVCDATTLTLDAAYDDDTNPMQPGTVHAWPDTRDRTGKAVNLSLLPAVGERQTLFGYLSGFKRGRAIVRNKQADLEVELSWPRRFAPFAWLWQEVAATSGFPWFGRAHMVAIEPATSIPGHGLAAVVADSQTHRVLQPDRSFRATVRMSLANAAPKAGRQR